MKYSIKLQALLFACLFVPATLIAQKTEPVNVDIDKPKAAIQSTIWGIFFEDINFAADGGIYAELVKNRSFEFRNPRTGWKVDVASSDSSHFLIPNRSQQDENNPRSVVRIKIQ